MKIRRLLVIAALLSACTLPGWADTLLTYKVHTDPSNVGGASRPAKEEVQKVWVGRNAVRKETEAATYIYRAEDKKIYVLNIQEKTYSVLDVPVDLVKVSGPETRYFLEGLGERVQYGIEIKPTDEKKKIDKWEARRFDVVMGNEIGATIQLSLWTTTSVAVEAKLWSAASAALQSLNPGFAEAAAQLAGIEGVPVLVESTMKGGPNTITEREELASVETKPAPAGAYEAPAGFTAVPFNPLRRKQPSSPGPGVPAPDAGGARRSAGNVLEAVS